MKNLGISETEALCNFRLAPLSSRRDIALLGVIHRSVLGLGPTQFSEHFKPAAAKNYMGREAVRRHGRQLQTHRQGQYLEILGNSILGLIDVYNLLPTHMVNESTVTGFQTELQKYLVKAATSEVHEWQNMYSPRLAIYAHPLRKNALATNGAITDFATMEDGVDNKCNSGWLRFGQ